MLALLFAAYRALLPSPSFINLMMGTVMKSSCLRRLFRIATSKDQRIPSLWIIREISEEVPLTNRTMNSWSDSVKKSIIRRSTFANFGEAIWSNLGQNFSLLSHFNLKKGCNDMHFICFCSTLRITRKYFIPDFLCKHLAKTLVAVSSLKKFVQLSWDMWKIITCVDFFAWTDALQNVFCLRDVWRNRLCRL